MGPPLHCDTCNTTSNIRVIRAAYLFRMEKTAALTMSMCALLLSGAVWAQHVPEPSRWYVGSDPAAPRLDRDRVESGFGLKLGYRLSPRWSLEGGYANVGRIGIGAPTAAPSSSIGAPRELRPWSFSGLGDHSAGSRPYGLAMGAGASYDISPTWFGRAGWDRYARPLDGLGGIGYGGLSRDVDFYGIGIGRRF
jgi:hypothetical protein